MKKILFISSLFISFLMFTTVASAQGKQQGSGTSQQESSGSSMKSDNGNKVNQVDQGNQNGQNGIQEKVQDPAMKDTMGQNGSGNGQQYQGIGQSNPGNKGLSTAMQKLNQVMERTNNPEVGEQVRSMVQSQEKVQTQTETSLQQMSQRNQMLKLVLGPDYKNAGEVRSNIANLRNDVTKLEKLKASLEGEDAEDVQAAIDELKAEANNLETQVETELQGFSLFGWLTKYLAQ